LKKKVIDYNYSNSTKVIYYNYDYFYLGRATISCNINDCLG